MAASPAPHKCNGTVTLSGGRTWGAYKFATGEVYANPMSKGGRIVGFAVVPVSAEVAATYRNA